MPHIAFVPSDFTSILITLQWMEKDQRQKAPYIYREAILSKEMQNSQDA